jgi:hypothetical protein
MGSLSVRTQRAAIRRAVCAVVLPLAACSTDDSAGDAADAAPDSAVTAHPEWRPLFDGATTSGWRGYGKPDMPAGWQVVDGALTRVGEGGDIITTEQYANFELELEWMVKAGGNSGIFYRGVENTDAIYYSAPEMQVLDDAVHADGKNELTSAGSNYALHPAPRGVVKPVGEWNAVRIVANGDHIEHWLNGQKIIEYEINSDDWKQRVAASKFKDFPGYGQAKTGYIGLQDHGDWVAFRNIRIKVLP